MTNKFTAIYVENWMSGSRMFSATKCIRLEQEEGETVLDMLKRAGVEETVQYLFVGHPKFQGE
jgi:hypothetical protein